ncbi:MAG: alanine--tRNA ligase [Acidobacteriota bacterium]
MEGGEVRRQFLEYFQKHGHTVVRSSPLIPAGDPTLLFSNAGMNQFKDLFLGQEQRDYRRATSAQKCLRVSGKHNDFDQVGRTARHHTFFEMLGNFSFGDYFKREAIEFAWDLITREFGLPADRLWITVFRDDDESVALWREISTIAPDRIVKMDEKDNFWAMGDTGPCGPCSEIYFDQGPGVGCGRSECSLECGCDRFLEFWNLVFMQYDRQPDGRIRPLAAPCIDTGAGLERLAAILQGVDSNYKTDLFAPLIDAISQRAGVTFGSAEATDVSLQVVADHLRAIAFLIADGVVPSNEKRGYILRRIIRRAVTYGLNIGLQAPFLFELSGRVVEMMAPGYPELETERERIASVCRLEEMTFKSSLARGMAEAEAVFSRYEGKTIPAEAAVKLWTTHGVTLEIQRALAVRRGVRLPEQSAIENEMEKHRETARASWKGTASPAWPRALLELPRQAGWSNIEFLGYEHLEVSGTRVTALANTTGLVETLEEGEQGFVVLDRTPFYAESGGQVGDTGQLRTADGSVVGVQDTQSPVPSMIVHVVTVMNGSLQAGERVLARVDPKARAATMRNHTATHLLHAALKRVLGPEVQQAGSYVGPDRLRFDFNYHARIGQEDLDRIEDEVNERILSNVPVSREERSFEEAMAGGAIALFGEKYGDRVRVVTVPGYSQELCGGTHCSGTGDIGFLKIVSSRGIAAGVRRIEAVTGMAAIRRSREDARILDAIEARLKAGRHELEEALSAVLAAQKAQAREIEKLRLRLAQLEVGSDRGVQGSAARYEEVAGTRVIARLVADLDRSSLRSLADELRREVGSGVVVLASTTRGKVSLLAAVTEDLRSKLDARILIKDLAALLGGGGGGNALLAEAGGKDVGKAREIIASVPAVIARRLASRPDDERP